MLARVTLLAALLASIPVAAQRRAVNVNERDTATGDAPSNAGPLATDLSPAMRKGDIQRAMRKVADWQLARISNHPSQDWTFAPLYSGFLATSKTLHDPRYHDHVLAAAQHFHWTLGTGNLVTNANEHALGYAYVNLYAEQREPQRIAALQAEFQNIKDVPPTPASQDPRYGILWWWCDALYMAPPTWAALSHVTHDPQYLDYADREWHNADRLLWSDKDHLYFRDRSFLNRKQANGEHIFWSRGNGWVMGGLVGVLSNMGPRDPRRSFYVTRLRQMSAKLLTVQQPDGLWRTGLLDPTTYAHAEVSGSAFNLYAMAWAVNNGVLPSKTYAPAIAKGWHGLVSHIYADGRLGSIQPVGDAPGVYAESASYTFGVGAFLLAGSEIEKLATE